MQYLRSVQFIFDRKNWPMNLLFGVVCLIVPIVGAIVLIGYLFEVIDALHRDPEHKDYPDFDTNRLMEYLMRGAWPFLMELVVALVIGVPLGLVLGVLMVVAMAIAASTKSVAVVLLFDLVMFVVILAVSVLSAVVQFPAALQAGLGREFNITHVIAFVKDFNKRVFKELLLSLLFLVAVGLGAEFLGVLLCGIGIFFTVPIAVMAQYHLKFQLYELYLERGGTPVMPATRPSYAAEPPPGTPRYPDTDEPGEPDERIRGER